MTKIFAVHQYLFHIMNTKSTNHTLHYLPPYGNM